MGSNMWHVTISASSIFLVLLCCNENGRDKNNGVILWKGKHTYLKEEGLVHSSTSHSHKGQHRVHWELREVRRKSDVSLKRPLEKSIFPLSNSNTANFFFLKSIELCSCVSNKGRKKICLLTHWHLQGDSSGLPKRKDEEFLYRDYGPSGPDYPTSYLIVQKQKEAQFKHCGILSVISEWSWELGPGLTLGPLYPKEEGDPMNLLRRIENSEEGMRLFRNCDQ